MHTPKLSVLASSADAVTRSPHYGFEPFRNAPSANSLQNTISRNKNGDSAVIIESLSTTGSRDLLGAQASSSRPLWKTKRPKKLDLGLWLLCNFTFQHSQWERVRQTAPKVVEAIDASFDCSSRLKRSFDIMGSLFLLVMLFPLFVLIAFLIKLDSPGPVLFRHYRVGRNGQTFVLWKFRSMRTDVPKYATSPRSAADGRLTRVGRLIRRFSIDEIPQLINVLRGEMSLVGPRPEMPFIVDRYCSAECLRLVVKPGVTGLWQVGPDRLHPIHENLQYDLHYIYNQNFILDCAIIARTIIAVIHGIGAV